MVSNRVIVRQLGRQAYTPVWRAMQTFTANRDDNTCDELWLVEHDPVFTQGQAGKDQHLLLPGDIPVVSVDRGGQITYHGPGQQMLYVLLDLGRLQVGVRQIVTALEQTAVQVLALDEISAYPRADAPGVYVADQKICSVGLRIRKSRSLHGLAFNVNMDLSPFQRINPCGQVGLQMTDSATLGGVNDLPTAGQRLVTAFCEQLQLTPSGDPTPSFLPAPQAQVNNP